MKTVKKQTEAKNLGTSGLKRDFYLITTNGSSLGPLSYKSKYQKTFELNNILAFRTVSSDETHELVGEL